MNDFVVIINKATTYWVPPHFGEFMIGVDQVGYIQKSDMVSNTLVNLHLQECNGVTYINGHRLFNILHTALICEYKSYNDHQIKYVKVDIQQPAIFYFSDEDGNTLHDNTPIIKLHVKY